jgi:hypothetical protein
MTPDGRQIPINRAPVLTLWATVVAERLGFNRDEALTLGRAVAGLNAHAKAVSLGIVRPTPGAIEERRRSTSPGEVFTVDLLGRPFLSSTLANLGCVTQHGRARR